MYTKNDLVKRVVNCRSLIDIEKDRQTRKQLKQELAYYEMRLLTKQHYGAENGEQDPIRVFVRKDYTIEEKFHSHYINQSVVALHRYEIRSFDDVLLGTIIPESLEEQVELLYDFMYGDDITGLKIIPPNE